MRVLSVDTTGEHGSLALVEDSRIVEEISIHSPEGFSPILFGEIQALLRGRGIALTDIDVFAAASGPGSFTGVRVGLTAMKGFAEALHKKAVGVSNLRAIASFGECALRAPVTDARRGEIYGAVYDSQLREVAPEAVMKFGEWLQSLPTGDLEILSLGYEVPADTGLATKIVSQPLAGAVGRIAAEDVANGAALEADANYVRRSDAELFWRDAS